VFSSQLFLAILRSPYSFDSLSSIASWLTGAEADPKSAAPALKLAAGLSCLISFILELMLLPCAAVVAAPLLYDGGSLLLPLMMFCCP
jgi:hypothetical protein